MRSTNSISEFVVSGIRHNMPRMHIDEVATNAAIPDSDRKWPPFPPLFVCTSHGQKTLTNKTVGVMTQPFFFSPSREKMPGR